jgi:tetratricopeptide (TPR) repeat protein
MDDPIADLISQAKTSQQRGKAAEALAHYHKAAARARQSGDLVQLAYCLRHVSAIALELNDNEAALSAGEEAVAIYRECADDPLGLANALRVTGLAQAALGQRDEAAACWFEARNLYQQLGIQAGVAEADDWLGATPIEPPPPPL